jgi:hypothetical protein
VGVTTAGSSVATMEGTEVRARERVHRFPFTVVVIDSCGVAMQTTGSWKETPTRARGRRRRERTKRRGRS